MKIPSRNKTQSNITKIKCPFCKCEYSINEETEIDYYTFKNTKIHICRQCFNEFVNGITRDVEYVYSGKCRRRDAKYD